MKYYLQTLSPDAFMQINQAVSLAGVYTEPTDFSRQEIDVMSALSNLLEVMADTQTLMVTGLSSGFRSLLEEGKTLQKLSGQLMLNVPASEQGFMAAKAARRLSLPVGVTSIFSAAQASLALHNEAGMVLIDLEKAGRFTDSEQLLQDVLGLVDPQDREKILVICSSSEYLTQALRCGAQAVAAPVSVYGEMLYNVLTDSEMAQAREEWLLAYTRNSILE